MLHLDPATGQPRPPILASIGHRYQPNRGGPSLRAKRSNPGNTPLVWIASSASLLAMTVVLASLRAKRSNPGSTPLVWIASSLRSSQRRWFSRHCERAAHCRAKQSREHAPRLDCFVASLLAMTMVLASLRASGTLPSEAI
ncbi:MAG: hypothetical protein LBT00_15125 [Spirochaetaceae bacterium]|nr:hypothetical protein [Spirochaetaceae bacterium]